MSIVTFWNSGKEQTGKTLSIAAIATYMAIEHNYRILIVSTGEGDTTLDRCFWEERKVKRIMKSNKLEPENITNYTKIVFKDRLEILQTYKGNQESYKEFSKMYVDIINLANNYYDLVLVDLDTQIDETTTTQILDNSNLIVVNLSQRLASINKFIKLKEQNPVFNTKKALLLIGRYDKFSKYSIKNISRYMNEKNKVSTIPYNTLFFEAAEEAKVPDLFLRLRKTVDEDDRNGFFIAEVGRTVENIIYRLQDLQMKMG